MDHVDCFVIGAGAVGLAVARALAQAGLDVVIVEQATGIGTGVSSRNSEVIHAGLYYAAGSLKSRLCVRGASLLYDYCDKRGVAHSRCGKLVVATRVEDLHKLDTIAARATAAGVHDLRLLGRDEACALEPALECVAALWSPASGIIDSHALMTALLGDAQRAGAVLALASAFDRARRERDHWVLCSDVDAGFEMGARWIINCAGLDAQRVAMRMHGFPAAAIPTQHLAKGHYFSLTGRAPFSRLIYPTPVDGGLGVHLTLDLGGQARFGPDVEWLANADASAIDYRVDESRAPAFEADIRRYWPGLPAGALQPAYSGVRPKLSGPLDAPADFRIDGPSQHGCAGVVQLFGIESPGLTASLAIGEHVAAMVCAPR